MAQMHLCEDVIGEKRSEDDNVKGESLNLISDSIEAQREVAGIMRCAACQTACAYRKSRVEEKYLPSMLSAPKKGPVALNKFDVAVVLRKVHKLWKESGYYPGQRAPSLRPDTWIIVVEEDGVKHYSWQEWVPTLESLKEGALFEATISWRDVQSQLKTQRGLEQKRFNDRVRQFFLEKYGERVLTEWRNQEDSRISEDVFRRMFFRKKDEQADKSLETDGSPSTRSSFDEDREDGGAASKKESYVVSWEPETGGLMGNQVTDSHSAQISLLPGTKYLVRIASNEGPGSFPIEVDTRPGSIQVQRVAASFWDLYPWDVYAACACAAILILVVVLFKTLRRRLFWSPEWREHLAWEVKEEDLELRNAVRVPRVLISKSVVMGTEINIDETGEFMDECVTGVEYSAKFSASCLYPNASAILKIPPHPLKATAMHKGIPESSPRAVSSDFASSNEPEASSLAYGG
ncbi:hypothetical protein KM043_018437 [Ampulex compressa]|nr:hypothetical protein KM043_018437 [Ampulex compressa]